MADVNATANLVQTYRDTTVINACLRKKVQTPNEYDSCLFNDHLLWDEIVAHGGLDLLCCPKGRPKYSTRPWIAMPAEGRRFKPVGILALPAGPFVSATNIPIPWVSGFGVNGNVYVPTGYDGVITDVVCEIAPPSGSGTGFTEGSGDITWRLAADRRWLRDMGNIQVTMGSLTSPSPVPRGGLRVYSNDLLQFFVALKTGADARLVAGSNIIVSISGWYWPR